MNFKCCKSECLEIFENANETIKHLKNAHNVVENQHPIECIVNNHCAQAYLTFGGLRKHVKQCINTIQNPVNVMCKLKIDFFFK